MKVPDFIDNASSSTQGRELLASSEIDVSRDLLEFNFVGRGDMEP